MQAGRSSFNIPEPMGEKFVVTKTKNPRRDAKGDLIIKKRGIVAYPP